MAFAVRVGQLIDGTGNPPLTNCTVIIERSTIQEIFSSHSLIPSTSEVLDFSALTVIPGLIDTHVHLSGSSVPNSLVYRVSTPPSLAVFYSARNAQKMLSAGFTTCRTMGGLDDVSLREAINLGFLPGPRVVVAGMVLMTGGHSDRSLPFHAIRAPDRVADGPDEVRKNVRRLVFGGVDSIKIEASGGLVAMGDRPEVRGYSPEEIGAAVDEAHSLQKRVAAHAHSAVGIWNALDKGVDSIEHGSFADDAALDRMAEQQVYLVPTLMIAHYSSQNGQAANLPSAVVDRLKEVHDEKMKTVARALRKGVKIALGTDASGNMAPHGCNGLEFHLLVEAGLSPMASIEAGTRVAAELLGLSDSVGTIEKGKRADFVVLDGNPLQDISLLSRPEKILAVYKEGKRVVSRLDDSNRAQLEWQVAN